MWSVFGVPNTGGGFQDQVLCIDAVKPNRLFVYCECSDFGVCGWVITNPNIVRIFKSVGNNGRSLTKK